MLTLWEFISSGTIKIAWLCPLFMTHWFFSFKWCWWLSLYLALLMAFDLMASPSPKCGGWGCGLMRVNCQAKSIERSYIWPFSFSFVLSELSHLFLSARRGSVPSEVWEVCACFHTTSNTSLDFLSSKFSKSWASARGSWSFCRVWVPNLEVFLWPLFLVFIWSLHVYISSAIKFYFPVSCDYILSFHRPSFSSLSGMYATVTCHFQYSTFYHGITSCRWHDGMDVISFLSDCFAVVHPLLMACIYYRLL